MCPSFNYKRMQCWPEPQQREECSTFWLFLERKIISANNYNIIPECFNHVDQDCITLYVRKHGDNHLPQTMRTRTCLCDLSNLWPQPKNWIQVWSHLYGQHNLQQTHALTQHQTYWMLRKSQQQSKDSTTLHLPVLPWITPRDYLLWNAFYFLQGVAGYTLWLKHWQSKLQ